MSFSKVIKLGSNGSLTVSESQGVAKIAFALSDALDAGAVGQVAKATVSAELDVSALDLAQMGLDLIKSKLPVDLQGLVTELEAVALPLLKNS